MDCVAGIALSLTACALSACIATPQASLRPPARAASSPAATTIVYLVRRKWHLDVGFASADLRPPLKSLAGQFPQAQYAFFGFGDRHYLLAGNHGVPTLLGALWPGPGLVLMTTIEGTPASAFGAAQVIRLEVSAQEALDTQAFIRGSIVAPYASGPYEGSQYFSAVPRYSALHTCNTWAAESLASAGLPVRTHLVLFARQLWSSALKLAARADATGVPAPVVPPP